MCVQGGVVGQQGLLQALPGALLLVGLGRFVCEQFGRLGENIRLESGERQNLLAVFGLALGR